MIKTFLILSFKGIRYRKLRSWLTIVGIVIGIMLVVFILSLGSGIKFALNKQLQQFGSDLIIITPGKLTNPITTILGEKFKIEDIEDLELIEGVDYAVGFDSISLNVEFEGEQKTALFHAAPWKGLSDFYESSQGLRLEYGRWPTRDDANELVLGYLSFRELFKNQLDIGDEVTVKSKKMTVIGAVSEIGNQTDDNVFYISAEKFQEITGQRYGARSAFVKTKTNYDINLIAKKIESQLNLQQEVKDFTVLTPEKTDQIVGDVLNIIELSLVIIALISLLVGAVGIMNTMYTSVLERTKEIGIMKALGARSDDVMSLFLIESGLIGLVGGVIGVALGLGLAMLSGLGAAQAGIEGFFTFAGIDYLGMAVVLIVTFIVGLLSGVLPARQAAKMEPAEALRYE
ncbi:MAG: hypothetical protein COT81_05200 [Candidatus Buchananbacteria bacterium CG10_big_fil_rev_8_21_14_0_10_42_9]|uniref:ABC transporter permease n=1 Tax=Candidatus Buchananbacteria bacterium CG10_big_fil_rev_8_21_14_0_10_42_9 TaxID=1974526 RepID=A0A2H0W015_9BACT|nr:MAG: hypothetical protein COT81_05200 [Candidatus Buchananbacteria bacterium CG10_big_fil_rev_8_21_14_0_10_42_9]